MAPPARTNPRAAPAAQGFAQMNGPTQAGVIAGVVVVLLVFYYMFLYQPLAEQMQHEQGRTAEVQSQLTRAERDLRQYNADVAELERSRARERELQRILPDTADIPGFLRNINTLAEASGLTITRIEPTEEKAEQYYVRVPVRLEVSGSYLALARFFRAVSQLPRVINMENITLETPARDENNEVKLRAMVLATTFRSLNAEEQARAAAPATGAARPGAQQGGRR